MTDELERLKQEAAERRAQTDARLSAKARGGATHVVIPKQYIDAEDALDRAIAIAEEKQTAFNMMMDSRVEISTGEAEQMRGERDRARADVKKLRQFIAGDYEYAEHDKNQNPVTLVVDVHAEDCSYCRAKALLADTDREEYR